MNKEYLDSGITLFSNFLSDSEISQLSKILDSIDEDEWYHESLPDHWSGKVYLFNLMPELVQNINDRIKRMFKSYLNILEISSFQRLRTGDTVNYHTDNGGSEKDNKFGIVIYINDNYDGGEIHYPEIDIKYHPKSGDMVIHNANIDHGVTEVTNGTRYMMTCFVSGNDETPAILNKEFM